MMCVFFGSLYFKEVMMGFVFIMYILFFRGYQSLVNSILYFIDKKNGLEGFRVMQFNIFVILEMKMDV